MGGVALHATLGYGSMLESKGPLIFSMTTETKFVGVGQFQIVSRAAAMRIMAIHAGHLAFTNWMVIRKIRFGVLLAARIDRSRGTKRIALEFETRLAVGVTMNGVAVAALDVLRLVGTGKPVPHVIGFRVATQANAVCFLGGAVTEADDLIFRFRRIPARRNMQTTRSVTLFAGHFLNRVSASAIGLREISMTSSTLFLSHFLRTRNVHELAEILSDLVRCAGLAFILGGKRGNHYQRNGEEQR